MLATLFRSALKMKTVREGPEGMCQRCAGTGNGEEVADLAEARFHGGKFPVKICKSCNGTGMRAGKSMEATVPKPVLTGTATNELLSLIGALKNDEPAVIKQDSDLAVKISDRV